jgi:hypothetical protein
MCGPAARGVGWRVAGDRVLEVGVDEVEVKEGAAAADRGGAKGLRICGTVAGTVGVGVGTRALDVDTCPVADAVNGELEEGS